MTEARLVLSDGSVFDGEAIGSAVEDGVTTGEAVFNTVMSGYQEVITDPSYAGQVIAFTYPHVGNYGVAVDDDESRRPHCKGIVVRDLTMQPSSWRSNDTLQGFMERHELPGITGVDTRRLTRILREQGSMGVAFGTADAPTLLDAARADPGTSDRDLVAEVTTTERYSLGDGPRHVVAYDYGIKRAILRNLAERAKVTIVPAATTADEVLSLDPDGVFLSNGPGDPSAVVYASASIGQLLGKVPVFGICLGHQLLARSLGAETFKLPFGHHGGNHPVRRLSDNAVEITSQNHNYAVVEGSLANADVSHVNLNDGVIEGIRCNDVPAFSVQYHPEAGPGPHDARYLFSQFDELMNNFSPKKGSSV